MSVRFRLSVSRLFDRVSVSVDLVSVCDRVEITRNLHRRRMGITVVRAMARHRWRHSQYVGLTRVQLEHSRRRADREHQRQAREQAERRSEEVVRMAQEHYFPWRPEW